MCAAPFQNGLVFYSTATASGGWGGGYLLIVFIKGEPEIDGVPGGMITNPTVYSWPAARREAWKREEGREGMSFLPELCDLYEQKAML